MTVGFWEHVGGAVIGAIGLLVIVDVLIEPGIELFRKWWDKPVGRYR